MLRMLHSLPRSFRPLALPLLVALAISPLANAAPLRFAWLSDTHVGSGTGADDLRASVQDINAQTDLSFVIVSGDVTEYGSWEQLKLAHEILGQLKIPSHVIPGNHDTKWSESGATDFGRLWKEDRFIFDAGGFRFIGLHEGPLMKMGDGHWAPQDVRWLQEKLRRVKSDKPLIFVTHYPIDDGIANWFAVLDLLKQHQTQVVLCGHGHASRKMEFEGIPGVMGRSNLRAREAIGGYNIVQIEGGQMTFAERNPGKETKPVWHTVKLGKHDYLAATNHWPRPDFSMNSRYPNVREKWVVNTGFTVASTPALWRNLAIVGDASGTVYAFDTATGKTAWKFRTGNAVYSTPAVDGDVVVVPSADGKVYALRADNGKKLWSYSTPRPIVASPAIATASTGAGEAKLVFVGSSEGKFRALDLKSGKPAWEYGNLRGFVETRPLIHEGQVIFGAWDQHLYSLDAGTGALKWKWKGDKAGTLLSPAAMWPIAAHGKVFIVAPDRQMTAVDAATGAQLWRSGEYQVRESIGLSADQQRFYVRSMNDHFYSFATEPSSPTKVWDQNAHFGYDINSAMLVEKDGVVFYGTKNGLLFALDSKTGNILWEHKLGAGVMNTVLPLDSKRVLVTNFDGQVALIAEE